MDAMTLVEELRSLFITGKTKNVLWRIEQLKGIERLLTEREKEVGDALKQDLNKPFFESYALEIHVTREAAALAAKSVKKWMTPKKVSTLLASVPSSANIVPEPLGVVLVISTWNYPFSLSLEPVIGAIAAGNAVVLKPSEVAPASSALLAKLLPLYVDSSAVRVVEGGIPETTALLDQRWDKIFYTGNARVGKIIMAAAAKHLTPVTLELGGKSPSIVDSTANIDVAARRICWGKWASNNGQTCICPDYVLAEESILPTLVDKIKDNIKGFYGEDPGTSSDIARLVNEFHFERITGLLNHETTLPHIIHGGKQNDKALYVEPTLILDPPLDSPVMQEEIFGPLLVIITVKNMDEAVRFVNSQPKPLALYLFTQNKKTIETVLRDTSSGGVTINDTILHAAMPTLPFGGVGDSGIGGYHGKFSFDTFSHMKPVLYRYTVGDFAVRYPPYTSKKQKMMMAILNKDWILLVLALLGLK